MNTRNLSLKQAAKSCFVYGDDIICSSADQAAIRHYLPKFSLLVNDDKSCTHGFFRESCGCDAYKGVDVTPLKVSAVWCNRLRAGTYDSYVSYSNELYRRGYYDSAQYIENLIQRIRTTPYTGSEPQGIAFYREHVIARISNSKLKIRQRLNKKTHRIEAKGWCNRPSYKRTAADDWESLLYATANNGKTSLCDEKISRSLDRSSSRRRRKIDDLFPESTSVEAGIYVNPHRNRLQRGWIAVH